MQGDQQVAVAGDQRRLGDEAEMQAGKSCQNFEHPPGHLEPALRRLVRVGGRANDQGMPAELPGVEGPSQHPGCVELDENPRFE